MESKKISIDPKKNKRLEENLNGSEREKIDSIKAIALIRAYRIRGHLIANLDPLGLMKREYLYELHPCLLYTSPSPRDPKTSRMPSSA